ncbi:hypothetical protein BH18ACI1_BH18ACI1_16640 [soil metagenome]
MKRLFLHCSIVCGVIFGLFSFSLAQDATQTRSITSDDFASQRPKSKKADLTGRKKGQTKQTNRHATYKFVRQDKNIVRRKTNQTKPQIKNNKTNTKKPEKVSEVGVTMWKLRPPRSSDAGYKLPVLVNNLRQMWTAERVNPDMPFQAGDRVRLAVESSDVGYLYVIDSETYSDGSYGEPFLIFPASTNEDNSVQPGLLVDIPDQTEDLPYFLINPKQANYTGELLTVIISPKPLTNIKIDKDGKIKNLDELIELETNPVAEIFSRNDAEDKIYTQAEADSACGAKARQQNNRQLERPCGAKTRQLTREEPLPQTIYRVKTAAGQPAVAFIRLNVRR